MIVPLKDTFDPILQVISTDLLKGDPKVFRQKDSNLLSKFDWLEWFFIVQDAEVTGFAHFLKNFFDCKKASGKSNLYYFQRITTINGSPVVT